MARKELTVESYVPITNEKGEMEYVLLDSLPEDEQAEIIHELGEHLFKGINRMLQNNLPFAKKLYESGVITSE